MAPVSTRINGSARRRGSSRLLHPCRLRRCHYHLRRAFRHCLRRRNHGIGAMLSRPSTSEAAWRASAARILRGTGASASGTKCGQRACRSNSRSQREASAASITTSGSAPAPGSSSRLRLRRLRLRRRHSARGAREVRRRRRTLHPAWTRTVAPTRAPLAASRRSVRALLSASLSTRCSDRTAAASITSSGSVPSRGSSRRRHLRRPRRRP